MKAIFFASSFNRDWKKLSPEVQARLRPCFERLTNDDPSLDIKRLRGSRNEFRLRVGDYRVTFMIEADRMLLENISHRKDAYR